MFSSSAIAPHKTAGGHKGAKKGLPDDVDETKDRDGEQIKLDIKQCSHEYLKR